MCAVIFQSEFSSSQSSYPFSLSPKLDIPLSALSGISLGIGMYTNTRHGRHLLTEAQFESLDRIRVCGDTAAPLRADTVADRLSDGLLIGTILAALQTSLLVLPATNHDGTVRGTNAVMLIQIVALNQAATDLFKNYFHHARPYCYYRSQYPTYNHLRTQKGFGDVNRSFFSGHTSTTAAFSFLTADIMASQADRQFDKVLIWSTGALMPAVVGYLRVKAKKHFLIDVVVGYVTGAVIGFGIAELHKPGALHF